MVEYSTWVSIVWDSARAQGLQDTSFGPSQNVIVIAADIWNDRKAELKAASKKQARSIADTEVDVK